MTARILTATQYEVTLEEIARFEAALAQARADAPNLHPIQARALLASLQDQLDELKELAVEYEQEMQRQRASRS